MLNCEIQINKSDKIIRQLKHPFSKAPVNNQLYLYVRVPHPALAPHMEVLQMDPPPELHQDLLPELKDIQVQFLA